MSARIQFTGRNSYEVLRFVGKGRYIVAECSTTDHPYIPTRDGEKVARPGQWVVAAGRDLFEIEGEPEDGWDDHRNYRSYSQEQPND